MSKTNIRFSSEILRRLGEELNPSPDKGILELVKNAYDADAINCKVEFINTDTPGGSIVVSDDGDGMEGEDIENGWLVVGTSIKSPRQKTRLGRIPVGSKGLGRLAALRMGSRTFLTTRPKNEKKEYYLLIDWDDYTNVEHVDDVELVIEESQRPSKKKHGTEITIENLQNRISRIDVKRLARELIILADPFGGNFKGFRPILVAPEFTDLEAMVRSKYFNDADYHLIAQLDKNGNASASVVDWRGAKIFSASHEELSIRRNKEQYKCPPAVFDFWVFIIQYTSFVGRKATLPEVKNWLKQFGGVHIYHNSLRVIPYGNPGNDWLQINVRRAQSPEERPSTNTSIGRISISDTRELIREKTDRSGFIEGETFLELKMFAQDALEWMASRRMEVAEERRARERTAAPKKKSKAQRELQKVIESVSSSKEQVRLKDAFDSYDRSRDKEVTELQKEIQLYRTLSTAGITAATFAHESSGNPVKVITQSVKAIERRGKTELGEKYKNIFMRPVSSIIKAIKSLAVFGAVTLKLLDYEKRRPSRVDIHTVIKDVLDTFDPFLKGRNVNIHSNFCSGSPYLRGSEAAIESIITNLLDNSLAAFERSNVSSRKIVITTEVQENTLTISVIDNGPGIVDISKKDIWLPGRTTKKNGTGLGLTIVKDTVKDLGGNTDAIEHHSELGGAEIIIELPIIGV